jgi:hypothetical protein
MNRDIRLLESEFRASAAALGDWGNSTEGLETRIKSLGSQLDIQQSKVEETRKEYERLAEQKGRSSTAAKEFEIKLNKETETLNKMKTELKESVDALDKMGDESDQAGRSVDDLAEKEDKATKSTSKFKDVMKGLGTALKTSGKVIAGLAASVAVVGGAITGMVVKASDAAGELVDLSNQTGISVEELQEMKYVGDQVGVSLDTMTGAQAKMIKSMAMAKKGTGDATVAFAMLGISVTDSSGELRDSQTVMGEALDALGKMTNETERDAAAMAIFGKSAMDLNPLIKTGAEELAAMTEEAHKMGAVMDEEAVMGLEAFGDELASLKAGLQGTMGTIAAAFLPGFQKITGAAKGYMEEFAGIVSGSDGDLGKMAEGIGGLIGKIVNDIAGKTPELMNAGLGIIQGIITAITTNLPIMIPGVITIITSLVQFLVQNLPLLLKAGIDILMALIDGILPQLPMLIDTALKMIVTLANGITEAIPTLLPMIAEIIPQVILTLIENLPLLIDAALQLILALVDGLIVALPILIEYIPEIVQAIFDALIVALPLIGDAAVKLVLALIEGISKMMPKIGEAAGKLIVVLGQGIGNLRSKILEVGKNIVSGVWQGIKDKQTWFRDQVFAFFSNIVKGIKTALGIKSPSTVFAGIGENLALGLGKGFSGAFGEIERNVNSAIAGLTPNLSPVMVGGGYAGQNGGGYMPNINIKANVSNEIDMYKLARRVAAEIKKGK